MSLHRGIYIPTWILDRLALEFPLPDAEFHSVICRVLMPVSTTQLTSGNIDVTTGFYLFVQWFTSLTSLVVKRILQLSDKDRQFYSIPILFRILSDNEENVLSCGCDLQCLQKVIKTLFDCSPKCICKNVRAFAHMPRVGPQFMTIFFCDRFFFIKIKYIEVCRVIILQVRQVVR